MPNFTDFAKTHAKLIDKMVYLVVYILYKIRGVELKKALDFEGYPYLGSFW